ncbi:MAG: glycosyltransferase family 4 protein [Tagaea sp.]|nr:glycosyltransferase family 4 protein [Tagaea sp.]
MARALGAALTRAGHEVEWPSSFRSRDGQGDPERQARLEKIGERLAQRLIRRYRGGGTAPALWFTYHLHYKAPDHLGPRVAQALAIPYVVAEASVAMKRANGPWARGHSATLAALGQAQAVVSLNPADDEGVAPYIGAGCRRLSLGPFLDPAPYARPRNARAPGPARLLAVGMMRAGDKTESYRVLAQALARLEAGTWTLAIAGDGPARDAVEAMFAAFGSAVAFLGARDEAALIEDYAGADIFVWPSVNEAFGMALLEAQASALPALAGDFGGVSAILRDGETGYLARPRDAADFAAKLARLIGDPALRARMGEAARTKVAAAHSLDGAARRLDALLTELTA